VTIQLYFLWIKLIKLTPSGTQLTPDMKPVPFATLAAHLLIQIAISSNSDIDVGGTDLLGDMGGVMPGGQGCVLIFSVGHDVMHLQSHGLH